MISGTVQLNDHVVIKQFIWKLEFRLQGYCHAVWADSLSVRFGASFKDVQVLAVVYPML